MKHGAPVEVSITVSCGNQSSHPIPFHYYSSSTMPDDGDTSTIGDLNAPSSYSPWTSTPAPSSTYSIASFDQHHIIDDDLTILASMIAPIESTKTVVSGGGGGACQDIDDEGWVIDNQLLNDDDHPVSTKRLRLI